MSGELIKISSGGALTLPWGQSETAPADDPVREIRAGLWVAGLFFILFLGWAALARLDAAAVANGRVNVSGERQTVQHRDGGVVGAIFVREGQKVAKGQLLMRLAAADVQAEERGLASQVIGLLAQRARLRAEQLGLPEVPVPPEFATLSAADREEAQRALAVQRLQLQTRSSLLSTQQGVLNQQRAQISEQAQGYRRQLEALRMQERSVTDQLEGMRTVAEKGFVSKNRIRELERAQAEIAGQRGRLQAAISESAESVGESRLRVVETVRSQQEQIASSLRDTEFSLGELMPKWQAARDRLARTEVRAPTSGTVVGLTMFTVGGVVTPGQKLMDIVPQDMPMVIEARFSPNDVDDLATGQEADIRFTGLPDRNLPTLHGKLTRISADSFTDERTGESFFTGEIRVARDQIELIKQERGPGFALKPGMPVQIMLPLRERTALQYLLDPLTQTFWRSFREQ